MIIIMIVIDVVTTSRVRVLVNNMHDVPILPCRSVSARINYEIHLQDPAV
jgi:hypothetical protein